MSDDLDKDKIALAQPGILAMIVAFGAIVVVGILILGALSTATELSNCLLQTKEGSTKVADGITNTAH